MSDDVRLMSKIESMALWAYNIWGGGHGVDESVISALGKSGLIETKTVEQYYADEFGRDSQEYEDNHDCDEFSSISTWTKKGHALLNDIHLGLKNGELEENPKYENFS